MPGYKSKKMMSASRYEAQDILEEAIYKMASKRFESVDDYIRIAKQAIADIEKLDKEIENEQR